MYDNTLVNRS